MYTVPYAPVVMRIYVVCRSFVAGGDLVDARYQRLVSDHGLG